MMKRIDYQKPAAETVKLQHHRHLMSGSDEKRRGNGASMPQDIEAVEF